MSFFRIAFPFLAVALLALNGCAAGFWADEERVSVDATTERVVGLGDVAFLAYPEGFRMVTGNDGRRLDLRDVDGRRLAAFGGRQWSSLDARDGVSLPGGQGGVLLVVDENADAPRILTSRGNGPWRSRDLRGLDGLDFAPDAACLYHDTGAEQLYFFLTDGNGRAGQWLLTLDEPGARARHVRDLPMGGETGGCAVHDAAGRLYLVEEGVGVWETAAHPERAMARSPLALAEPWGQLREPTDVAVHEDTGTVLIADEGAGRLHLVEPDGVRGSVALGDGIVPEAVAVTDRASESFPAGAVAVADAEGERYHLLEWGRLARAAGLSRPVAKDWPQPVPDVAPAAETEPVASAGDAADDPAIWVHPESPEQSLILGTDKRGGLYVHDLQGRERQYLPDGRLNNVDLRDGFSLGGERVALVTATNRSDDTIAFYRVDPQERRLERVFVAGGPLETGFEESYGLCMYHDPEGDRHYVIANDKEGRVHQWRLEGRGERVAAERVRAFEVGSQTEGCVADDEHGHLFIGEEAVAIWRYSADPAGGTERLAVDRADGGHFTADVEGLALYAREDGTGFLVASSQGDDRFTVYRRTGDHAYVGDFRIGLNPGAGLDGASETDGIEVVSAPLGADYPAGLMVAQDGRNLMPPRNQNYKLVSWEAIRAVLEGRNKTFHER